MPPIPRRTRILLTAAATLTAALFAGTWPTRPTPPPRTLPPSHTIRNPRSETTVFEVEAGDRVRLNILRAEMPIAGPINRPGSSYRLLGVECPAPEDPFGREAHAFTASFLAGGRALARSHSTSKTDPLDGTIRLFLLSDGLELSHELVRNGLARAAEPSIPGQREALLALEAEARRHRRGQWTLPN